ncbi:MULTISPECIES: hypothetical protein [unclassified Pusillimonas]|uniref:hypothetical protein n=1 Tax=unclassified Pusillimonas TaxID=2640016 RepID=UPI000B9CE95E|nr:MULTISPECIES: hypothetical protein [unclassified Pusillimonas]OXR48515.1 hypothetical protein PuT2_12560 [Pusillimonas sp. T2]ROT46224.1 hypothetical protein CHR62_04480 [Pusillimonas sp. NJUB218]
MKIAIILVSILSMALTIGWHLRKQNSSPGRLSFRQKLNIVMTSLVIGIVVYFGLLLAALAWMALR